MNKLEVNKQYTFKFFVEHTDIVQQLNTKLDKQIQEANSFREVQMNIINLALQNANAGANPDLQKQFDELKQQNEALNVELEELKENNVHISNFRGLQETNRELIANNNELKNLLSEKSQENSNIDKQEELNQLTELNNQLATDNEALKAEIENFKSLDNSGHLELIESLKAKISELQNNNSDGDNLVLNLSPKETYLLNEVATALDITPKEVLIDRMFVPFIYNGPSDFFKIVISKSGLNKIDEYFKVKG